MKKYVPTKSRQGSREREDTNTIERRGERRGRSRERREERRDRTHSRSPAPSGTSASWYSERWRFTLNLRSQSRQSRRVSSPSRFLVNDLYILKILTTFINFFLIFFRRRKCVPSRKARWNDSAAPGCQQRAAWPLTGPLPAARVLRNDWSRKWNFARRIIPIAFRIPNIPYFPYFPWRTWIICQYRRQSAKTAKIQVEREETNSTRCWWRSWGGGSLRIN